MIYFDLVHTIFPDSLHELTETVVRQLGTCPRMSGTMGGLYYSIRARADRSFTYQGFIFRDTVTDSGCRGMALWGNEWMGCYTGGDGCTVGSSDFNVWRAWTV